MAVKDFIVKQNTQMTGHITVGGYLGGPATFVIDPAAIGDNTGTVQIKGNLQVDGTNTTINSATLTVDDKNIVIASGAGNASAADGAGLTIDGASATLTYTASNDRFAFNKELTVARVHGNVTGDVTGTVSDISNHSTTNLAEGTNLYYTDARVQTYIGGNRSYGNITSTGVTLTSTDTGSSAGPTLDLVRDSASPANADYLGQVAFKGDDAGGSQHTYAKITAKIGNATAGNEDGLIEFAVVNNGSNDIIARLKTDGILLNTGKVLRFEGATASTSETTVTVVDPTADRTITFPDASGTVALTNAGYLTAISLNTLSAGVLDTQNDSIAFIDANDSNNSKKETVADFLTAIAGSGITVSSGQLTASATETDTLDSVTTRGATTTNDISVNKVTSTVSTGTAPLVVSSTTKVANLNADKLDDKEFTDIIAEATALAIALG